MSIFKNKKRKEKRGIIPVAPNSGSSYWDSYESGEDDGFAVEPSYDRSPTTYDSPTYTAPSQSTDTGSSSGSGYSSTDSGYSSSGGDSGGGSW